jgi:hypothetical protein
MVEQYIATEDNNILPLMQSTVRYCLLNLYMAAGSNMADTEQNDAIKAHVRRTNHGGSDPDDDTWSTRSIYQSARSVAPTTTSRATAPAPALATSGSVPRGRPTAASRATKTATAQAAGTAGGGSGIGGASDGGATADHTAGVVVMEDKEEEVIDITPAASTVSADRMEHIISLISSIQGNDSQSAQSSLSALMTGVRQAPIAAAVHPTSQVLSTWARQNGYVKPESYKAACEAGGISYNTYMYLDNENGLVCTTMYEPWNLLARRIHKKFLQFRCSILTNTCMVSYRTT